MKDFKKLMIWQKGMDIVDRVYDLIPLLPAEEKYGVRSQLTRAALSVPVNIAEGSAKSSEKDYKRILEISLGSAFEVETLLIAIQRRKWVEESLVDGLMDWVKEEQKMLQSFIKGLG
jgi:four helix bundle protein